MKKLDKQEAEARIASIEAEAERIREWLNQQDTVDSQSVPEVDEVWEDTPGGRRFLMASTAYEQHCELPTHNCEAEIYSNDNYEKQHFVHRLGTFQEVYAERTKLREEGYIHKDEIERVLSEDVFLNTKSHQTRLSIAVQLGINY